MIRGILGKCVTYPRGLLGIGDLRTPSDFVRIASQRVAAARETMTAWRQPPPASRTPEQDIEILDSVSNSLCGIADAAEFIRNVHEDPQWIESASQAVQSVSSFMNDANVDSELFKRARNIHPTSEEHKRVISAMVDAMEHEGVGLENKKKKELISLLEIDMGKSFEIVSQSRHEGNNKTPQGVWMSQSEVQSPATASLLKQLPSRTESGIQKIFIPSELSSFLSKHIPDRSVRQLLWESSHMRTDAVRAKEDAMHELVQTRQRLASIRGYASWNHYAQRESVLTPYGGPAAVEKFLSDLWTDLEPGLAKELSVLSSLNNHNPVEPWDLDFLTESWKQSNPSATRSIQVIQTRMTLQRLLAGAQTIARKVLSVDLQHDSPDPLWHQDAFRLSLTNISGSSQSPFAYLYIDPYERASKLVQSAQYTIAGSKLISPNLRQIPQTAIVFGLPRNPSTPLPMGLAVTVFHELGHAFHSLLSETQLQHFSGSRGAIDFVEFPSHLFEYFATEPESLRAILPDVPESVLAEYNTNRSPFAHIEAAQQLVYALLDQVYYATGSPDGLVDHLPSRAGDTGINRNQLLTLLQPTSTSSFEHLVHYGGSYYCYLLSRALAANVWDQAFRNDVWNRDAGHRLVQFLKRGSVDQSLDAINTILPPGVVNATPVPTAPLIKDLSRCSAIHS